MRIILIIYISILTCISIKSQSNSALVLNGCTDVIEFPDNNHVDFDEAITITALIRPNCGDGNRVFLSKEFCSGQYAYYMSVIDQKLRWSYSFDGFCDDNFAVTSFDNVIPADQNSHVAVVHTLINVRFFVNGVEVLTDFSPWAGGRKIHDSNEPLRLGAYQNISQVFTNYYSGLIDDVTIWNKELTKSEINNLISNAPNTNDSNLMFYLDMEGSGIGDQLMLQNLATNASIGNSIIVGSNSNSPYRANGNSYSKIEFNIGEDTTVCTLPLSLNLGSDSYKSVKWSTGESTPQINISQPNTYVATIETEACRFFTDDITVYFKSVDTIFNSINLCQGDTISYYENLIHSEGLYEIEISSLNDCDTIINLTVSITDIITILDEHSICPGDTIMIDTIEINSAGLYSYTVENQISCDTIYLIDVIEISETNESINLQLCNSDTIIINNVTYSAAGSYTQEFISSSGCDSILKIEVADDIQIPTFVEASICEGLRTAINGVEYQTSGNYSQSLTSSTGCDSIITIVITQTDIYIPNVFSPNLAENDSFGPFIPCDLEIYEFHIYDKWGNLVFRSLEKENLWNGTYDGSPDLIQGVYTYMIRYGNANSSIIKSGNVLMLI